MLDSILRSASLPASSTPNRFEPSGLRQSPFAGSEQPRRESAQNSNSNSDWRRALELTAPIARRETVTLPIVIDNLADRFEDAPALIADGECLSFRALATRVHKYTRWAHCEGLLPGDVAGLLMLNSPEYFAIWLGLTGAGVIVALLNTHLLGEPLKHSINLVAPKHLIVGAEFVDAVTHVLPNLGAGIRCSVHGSSGHDLPRIDYDVDRESGHGPSMENDGAPSVWDRALYIYTSGTTGLPKAAIVSHFRLMQWTHWFAGMMDIRPTDRMYNCLPMYHSVGGIVATGAPLIGGAAVVIRDRFSASQFWDDVVEWDCTLFQYVGELCRYLLLSPPHAREARHSLRLCCGNGLRAEVWGEFQRRFQIPKLLEFYASTEGSFSLYNTEGKPGAIGRLPPFLAHRAFVALVKINPETGNPLRTQDGFCQRCSVNEVGEALGRVSVERTPTAGRFEGFTQQDASEQKVLHDVFAIGDAWFRTGDLMRQDQAGYFYFVDRVGDTFRWKGENVSTTEVEQVIAGSPGIVEAVVYGVEVPGMEGRAGMAAIVASANFNFSEFRNHLARHLHEYASPVFLRMRSAIPHTGTFKPQKRELAAEGCDPAIISDALYINNRGIDSFVEIDEELYQRLCAGMMTIKL
jgi:fatty-acyl-CoA synthase